MTATYTMSDIEETIVSEDAMTNPQRKYLTDLVVGKDHNLEVPPFDQITKKQASQWIDALKAFPWKPKAPVAPEPEPVTAGMYQVGDAIYKVQQALYGTGHLYAKRLVVHPVGGSCAGHYDNLDGSYFECGVRFPTTEQERLSREGRPVSYEDFPVRDAGCLEVTHKVSFEYEQGAMRKISAANRLTKEQAKAFGALYGTCVFCARTLTDERSIDAGYGPTCAATNGLPWGEKE